MQIDANVHVATAEDTMLAKLEWAARSRSERQIEDVVAIAAIRELDREYLSKWAEKLGVAEELRAALNAADALSNESSHS